MKIDRKIRDEKIQYEINREAANDLSQMIKQARFEHFPLGKAYEKQAKKHVDALKSLTLISVGFLGVSFEVEGVKLPPPCLNLVRNKLET